MTKEATQRRVRLLTLVQVCALLVGTFFFFLGAETYYSWLDPAMFVCSLLMLAAGAWNFWIIMGFREMKIEIEGWTALWTYVSVLLSMLGLFLVWATVSFPIPD